MSSPFLPCGRCSRHVRALDHACPFCGFVRVSTALVAAAAIFGATGCKGDDDDGPSKRRPAITATSDSATDVTTSTTTDPLPPTTTAPPATTTTIPVALYGPPPGPPPSLAPSVTIRPTGDAPLDGALARGQARFAACIETVQKKTPRAAGTGKVRLEISPVGDVLSAATLASTGFSDLDDCVRAAFLAMKLPPKPGKVDVTLTFTGP